MYIQKRNVKAKTFTSATSSVKLKQLDYPWYNWNIVRRCHISPPVIDKSEIRNDQAVYQSSTQYWHLQLKTSLSSHVEHIIYVMLSVVRWALLGQNHNLREKGWKVWGERTPFLLNA